MAGAGGAAGSGAGGGGSGGGSGCDGRPGTFADGKTPSSTLYVTGGASAGGDGSQGSPFATLAAAAAVAGPGARILISGEVVNDAQLTLNGTAAAPIFISGEPGAKVRGGSAAALRLVGSSYVVVEDLEFYESPNHVVHFDSSNHLLFRRIHAHRATTACMKGSQSTDVFVEDSDMHGAGELPGGNTQSTQVLDFVGVNTGHVVGSKFHDGKQVMIMLKGGTSDLFFAYNEVYDQTSNAGGAAVHLGQSTGAQFFQPLDADYEGLRIVAYANLIRDVAGPPLAFQGCHDCAAIHNTMWNTTGGQLFRFLPGQVGANSSLSGSVNEDCRYTGNIAVGGQAGGASLNADAPALGSGNTIDHHVVFKPGNLNWWGQIPQPMDGSSYDVDPMLDATGLPGNAGLVRGKGATDLTGVAFAEHFTRDYSGTCWTAPFAVGARHVP